MVNTDTRIHKERNTEREKERDKERDTLIYTTLRVTIPSHMCFSYQLDAKKNRTSNRISAQNNEPLRAGGARTRHILKEDND